MQNFYEQRCQAFLACYAIADFSRGTPGKFKFCVKKRFSVVSSVWILLSPQNTDLCPNVTRIKGLLVSSQARIQACTELSHTNRAKQVVYLLKERKRVYSQNIVSGQARRRATAPKNKEA